MYALKEKKYHFNNMVLWAKELNDACNSFFNETHYWPNIILASSITYNKIDIVANTRPDNIKGDGSSGMPINPYRFVSLSGFADENYTLDMCVNDKLPELSFKLVYDSNPDGEFVEENEDELEKAV